MRIAVAMALTLLVVAPALAQAVPPLANSKKIELSPHDDHEECLELAAGQRLSYAYSAGSSVAFNIHYHSGDKVAYPVRKNARDVRAVYMPHKAQGYCMMWSNPHAKPVTVEYSFDVAPAPRPR